MCTEKNKREKLFFAKYFLPPILFYFIAVPQHVGTTYIVDNQCGGILRGVEHPLNRNVTSVARIYDGNNCIGNKSINTDTDFMKNFGEAIGSFKPLLKYEVCFDQVTSLQNGEGPVDNPTQIILETYNKIPAELRIEAESGAGFEVLQGTCEEIPPWAQEHLKLKPPTFSEKIDTDLFERLKKENYLVSSPQDSSVYESQLFIENTTITVRPKWGRLYVFLGVTIGWILTMLQVIQPLVAEYRSLRRQNDNK